MKRIKFLHQLFYRICSLFRVRLFYSVMFTSEQKKLVHQISMLAGKDLKETVREMIKSLERSWDIEGLPQDDDFVSVDKDNLNSGTDKLKVEKYY